MIPLVNRPFLEHVIDYLKRHGIDDIILSMGYKPDVIEKHFGDGSDFGIKLTYVVEEHPLGTAGGVKNVEKHLDGPFFVFNGDVLTDLDLTAMYKRHSESGAKVTIAWTPVEDPTAYGLVETDSNLRVKAFIEKPSPDRITTNLINAGTYIIQPEALGLVPQNSYYMFERGLFPLLLERGDAVLAYKSEGYWIDMGTPEKYMKVNRDMLSGRLQRPLPGLVLKDGVRCGPDCKIDKSANLVGPVVIGKGITVGANATITGPVIIGDGATIGSECEIEDAIVWREASIGNRTVLNRCVVGTGSIIGDDVRVTQGAVVADHSSIGAGNRLEREIRISPHRVIQDNTIVF
jgi:mannose-1-phosphate guanylyltransferase